MFRLFKRSTYSNVPVLRSVLCSNPLLIWLQIGRMYLMALIGIGLLITFVPQVYILLDTVLSGRVLHNFFYYLSFPSYPVAIDFLIILSFIFISERYWKRIEVYRFAAIGDHAHLFANEQAEKNEELLFLPITIITRYKKYYVATIEITVFFLISISSFFEYLSNKTFFYFLISSPSSLIIIIVVIGCMIFLGSIILRASKTINLTEEGIEILRNNRSVAFIVWNEACLFSCYRPWGAQNDGDAMIYELSSSSAIIRWTWIKRSSSIWCSQKAVLPNGEYQRQMRTIIALVAQKTNLPLYNLNQKLNDIQPDAHH